MSALHIVEHQRALPNLAGPEATPRTRFLAAELKRLQDAVLAEAPVWQEIDPATVLVRDCLYWVKLSTRDSPDVARYSDSWGGVFHVARGGVRVISLHNVTHVAPITSPGTPA